MSTATLPLMPVQVAVSSPTEMPSAAAQQDGCGEAAVAAAIAAAAGGHSSDAATQQASGHTHTDCTTQSDRSMPGVRPTPNYAALVRNSLSGLAHYLS